MAIAPHVAANPYPQCGPTVSMIRPHIADPTATPIEIADDSQVMASVWRAPRAWRSISAYPAMSVGAIVRPAISTPASSESRLG